jgi:hypothetical protein
LTCFLCHQHKPHLVWNPDWLRHRNGADAITAVTYFASAPDAVADRLRGVWGAANVTPQPGGYRVATAGGLLHLLDRAGVAARFPGMALPAGSDRRAPCGVAISVHSGSFDIARTMALQAPGAQAAERGVLVPPDYAGGIILEIHA